MARVTKTLTPVRGRRYRVTRLDNCGNPVYGDNGQAVTSGVITATFSAQTTSTDEINVRNSSGEICVFEASVVSLEGFSAEIQFCGMDPDVFNMLTGMPVDYDINGRAVGVIVDTDVGDLPTWSILASAEEHDGLPKAWFMDPQLDGVTPLTIDGRRIFGHLAQWGTCHIGIQERCVMPPSSPSDYSYFHIGLTETDEGMVRTGTIVNGTGHANARISAAAATRHYDDTGYAVADITVGEDGYGIWFSGALRDDVTEAEIKTLRASAVSGDWRDVQRMGQPNEMVGLLAVNAPGFPMPRFGMEGDRQVSLIASAGMVLPKKESLMDGVNITETGINITWPQQFKTSTTSTTSAYTTHPVYTNPDQLAAIGRVVADELEFRAERKQKLTEARDSELSSEVDERRRARIAEAREV